MFDTALENPGPRLRTACDACQSYKVKCSRAKPSCWRCTENGTPCVYSPWRKTGRPPKHAAKGSRDVGGGKTAGIHHSYDGERGRQAKSRTQKLSSHRPSAGTAPQTTTLEPLVTGQQKDDSSVYEHQKVFSEVQPSSKSPGGKDNTAITSSSTSDPTTTQLGSFSMVDQDPMFDFSINDLSMDMLIPEFDMDLQSTGLLSTLGLETTDGNDIDDLTPIQPCVRSPFSQALSENTHQALEATDSITARSQPLLPRKSSLSSLDILTVDSSVNQLQTSSSSSLDMSRASFSKTKSKEDSAGLFPTKETIATRFSVPNPRQYIRQSLKPVHPPPLLRSSSVSSAENNKERNPRPQGCSCYHLLSILLGKVGGYNLEGNDKGHLSLDTLLDLDRELQDMVNSVLHCRRCMEKFPNQNIFMLIYMTLDGLLHAFESYHSLNRQAVNTRDSSPETEPNINSSHASTAVPQSSRRMYARNSWRHHGQYVQSQYSSKQELYNSRNWLKFPLCEEPLFVGSYMVDDTVKAEFLCDLLCDIVGNMTELLSNIDRQSAGILTGVNGRIAKTQAEDIHRRAILLRGRLRLDC